MTKSQNIPSTRALKQVEQEDHEKADHKIDKNAARRRVTPRPDKAKGKKQASRPKGTNSGSDASSDDQAPRQPRTRKVDLDEDDLPQIKSGTKVLGRGAPNQRPEDRSKSPALYKGAGQEKARQVFLMEKQGMYTRIDNLGRRQRSPVSSK